MERAQDRFDLIGKAMLVAVLAVCWSCIESNPQPMPGSRADTMSAADLPYGGNKIPTLDEGGVADAAALADTTSENAHLDDVSTRCPDGQCPAGPLAAPDPSVNGPYPVGATTCEIELEDYDGVARTIRVEVWYPTTDEFANGPFDELDFYDDAPDAQKPMVEKYKEQLPTIPMQVTRDSPVRPDGPYPLIVFSHGAYGVRFQSVFFTIPLASHGYVVASADHTGNVLYELFEPDGYNPDDMIKSALDRPLDVTAIIDTMIERSSQPGDEFEGSIDETAIGISGHSFGGYTALHLGFSDPRVKAVLPMSPSTSALALYGFELPAFPIPMMMMAGALDKTLNPETEMSGPFLQFPPPKFYFELTNGGHFTFSDICSLDLEYIAEDLGIEDAAKVIGDGCADFNIPAAEAHPMIRQFGIGFFNFYLRASSDSLKFFDSQAAAPFGDELYYVFEPGGNGR